MRVLWLSHLLPYPPRSGVQLRSFNLLKEVSRQHEVHFLAFNQPALVADEDVPSAVSALGQFCRVLDVLPIPSERSPAAKSMLAARSLFSKYPYTLNWLHSASFTGALRLYARQYKYDLVHFDTISLAPYRRLVRSLPASMTHHNIESDMMLRRAALEKNWLRRAYFWQEGRRLRIYERVTARNFDVHLTCSELDANRLRKIAPGAVTAVIPNGVDTHYFDPRAFLRDQQPESLVFAGGLDWYPNASAMRFFIDQVWPVLKAARPNATLTVIGRKPPTWLTDAAAADSNINVPGFVDDVRPHIAAAQVYICPIFDGGGTKLKVLDALSMGVPIVAHPVACEGIDVTPERNVLLASTPDEFFKQIIRLFADRQLRQALAQSGRKLAEEKYDFDEIGRLLCNLYDRLGNRVLP
jgi:glycosyltransferase involved in cell wall biosynthesis